MAAGAIAGATAELVGSSLEGVSDPNQRMAIASGIAQMGAMLAGGDQEDIAFAGQTASLVMTYNHMMHPDFDKKMDDLLEKKQAEDPEAFKELNKFNLDTMQEFCGESHCEEKGFFGIGGGIDTQKIKDYGAKHGIPFTDAELTAFEQLHGEAETVFKAEFDELNWENHVFDDMGNPTGGFKETPPLYIPDPTDRKAAAILLADLELLPDDIHSQIDEDQWNAYRDEVASLRANDPALDSAIDYLKSENNQMLLELAVGEVTGVGGPALAAKLVSMVRTANLVKGVNRIVKDYPSYTASFIKKQKPERIVTAEKFNSDISQYYPKPPFKSGTEVFEFKTTGDDTWVRVFTENETQPVGRWMMRYSDIQNKSPTEIKNMYDLKYEPTHIVTVKPSHGADIAAGITQPNNFGGSGDGIQFYLSKELNNDWFMHSRRLD